MAQTDLAALGEAPASNDKVSSTDKLAEHLRDLSTEMDSRMQATSQVLRSAEAGPALQSEAAAWNDLKGRFASLKSEIDAAATADDAEKQKLGQLKERWAATQKNLSGVPPEVSSRVGDIVARIEQEDHVLSDRAATLLRLQSQEADSAAAADRMIGAIGRAQNSAMNRLGMQDSAPLWSGDAFRPATGSLQNAGITGGRQEVAELLTYLKSQMGEGMLFLAIIGVLLVCFPWVARKLCSRRKGDPQLAESTRIFDAPIAAAFVASLALAHPIFHDPPHLLSALLGSLLLIPLMLLLRRLVEPSLAPLVWALAVFYLADRIQEAVAVLPVVPRLILLAEAVAAILCAIWLLRLSRARMQRHRRLWCWVRIGTRFGLGAFIFAAAANFLGYVQLALFITRAILGSAYAAVLFYTGVRIAMGLVDFALAIPPLSFSLVVRRHRPLLEAKCATAFCIVAVIGWAWFTLAQVNLAEPLACGLGILLTQQLRFGPVSAATLIEFSVTIWAAFLVSRLTRFFLAEEVYPRLSLSAGMPFAISTMLHYAILFAGFYLGAAALVGDMTKFTILAGAFSVGVGFGLQNVINNFVSGLIVLFERPIKLNDVIQVGSDMGTVERIGIRATIIRTTSGSEVIVPNGKLISDPVTNWTLSGRLRQVDLSLATPTSVEPSRVITLLEKVARDLPDIDKEPAPKVDLAKAGGGTFTFELRAWVSESRDWASVRTALTMAATEALQRESIPMA
jgi:small-conductance mechanosensitive channel